MKKHRALPLILLLVVGITACWTVLDYRRKQSSRDLVAAVKHTDTSATLAALKEGGNVSLMDGGPSFGQASEGAKPGSKAPGKPVLPRIYFSSHEGSLIGQLDGFSAKTGTVYGRPGYFSWNESVGHDIFGGVDGVAIDGWGRIYIADQGNQRVCRVENMLGESWISCPLHGSPLALFVTEAGRIYVLVDMCLGMDEGKYHLIRLEDMTGRGRVDLVFSRGSGKMQLKDPWKQVLFVDAHERIYIADTGNQRIVRLEDMQGNGWTTFGTGGKGAAQFTDPMGVCVDLQGRIYVADRGAARIVRFDDMTGKGWTVFTGTPEVRLTSPKALCVDRDQRIYFTEEMGTPRLIRMEDLSGRNLTVLKLPENVSMRLDTIRIVDSLPLQTPPPDRKQPSTPHTESEVFQAVYDNDIHAIQRWLDAGGDPNLRDSTFGVPLFLEAIDGDCPQILRLLLQHGANPRQKATTGWTALHSAVQNGTEDDVALFLKAGVDVNARDGHAQTALHLCCKPWARNDPKIVAMLLRHHANPNLCNDTGQTPLDLELSEPSSDPDALQIIRLLRQAGGKSGKQLKAVPIRHK